MTQEKDDDLVRLQVTRHLWPEEQEIKNLKKRNKTLLVICYVLLLLSVLLGGALFGLWRLKRMVPTGSSTTDGMGKIQEALSLMSNNWFFSNEIEDVEDHMVDQAITGMTTNKEDPHTEYMTEEEREQFYQSIDRNYVGIGVQFITTNDGIHIIERVLRDTPAEKNGVQSGDIIYRVDGVEVEGKTSDDIVSMVQGDEGTVVHIDFLRDGEIVPMDITRAPFQSTTFSEVLEGEIGYIELLQFGETTHEEIEKILKEFQEAGVKKLIIDLRDDGGGYLYSLQNVAGLFLPRGTVVLREVDNKGNEDNLITSGQQLWHNEPVVLLVNENTASAAEAFTLAMRELYPDVTVVGTKTYGKGTVQVSYIFGDGSTIKYTTSKWLSPGGEWVNQVGIEPDVEVQVPEAVRVSYVDMEDDVVYHVDEVSMPIQISQQLLEYLEYEIDRKDGYLSEKTSEVIEQFQQDTELEVTGNLDEKTYQTIISRVILDWNTTHNHDTQLHKALEILNG